jgi:glutaredoxin 3
MTIEIFTTSRCGYCERTKTLLERRGHGYVDLDVSADPAHLEEFRRRLPRVKAVPQIFIAGAHIGGYDDLCLLDMSGELAEMLGAEENP